MKKVNLGSRVNKQLNTQSSLFLRKSKQVVSKSVNNASKQNVSKPAVLILVYICFNILTAL